MSLIERAVSASAKAKPERRARAGEPQAGRPPVVRSGEPVAFSTRTLVNGGDLVTDHASASVFDQFRLLKRPALTVAFGPLATPGSNVLLVSSPTEGVGKTFVATNLAYAMALEKDRQVLLIDADNPHHSLTSRLMLDGTPGFFDVINDESISIEDVVRETDVPGLRLIAAGGFAPDSLERLNSTRCQQVVREIRSGRYGDTVILDAAPLLRGSDGPALAAIAGQVLMVVGSGVTPKSAITQALALLDRNTPVGLILNRAHEGEVALPYPRIT